MSQTAHVFLDDVMQQGPNFNESFSQVQEGFNCSKFTLTSKKGKTKPMVKLDSQLRQPATV